MDCRTEEESQTEDFQDILPSEWDYEIIRVLKYGSNPVKTEIKLKAAIFTAEEVKSWVECLELKTSCTYSIRTTEIGTGQRILYKRKLHCRHNTRSQKVYDPTLKCRTKNTNCPSSLSITIRVIRKKYRGDPQNAPDPRMPCVIEFVTTHNHETRPEDGLKFNRVSNEVKEKLLQLYSLGHTPVTALQHIEAEIVSSYENFESVLMDRRYCPDYNYCYYLFITEFKKRLELPSTVDQNVKQYVEFAVDNIGKPQFYKEETVMEEICINEANIEDMVISEVPIEETEIGDVHLDETFPEEDIIEEKSDIKYRQLLEKGELLIQELSQNITMRLIESPEEIIPGLKCLLRNIKKINSAKEFLSACSAFKIGRRNKIKRLPNGKARIGRYSQLLGKPILIKYLLPKKKVSERIEDNGK